MQLSSTGRKSRRNCLGCIASLGLAGVFAKALGLQNAHAGDPDTQVLSESESSTVKATEKNTTEKDTLKIENEIDYKAISKAEWKKRLTPPQYKVCREHGTEQAFSGKYFESKANGIYRCVCCETPLFDSIEKFDSKTGWPSFWKPSSKKMVGESVDHLLGYPRTEVHCNRCDAHLGHVFKDAPQTPTGLRYCINSVCLEFIPRDKLEKMKAKQKAK